MASVSYATAALSVFITVQLSIQTILVNRKKFEKRWQNYLEII